MSWLTGTRHDHRLLRSGLGVNTNYCFLSSLLPSFLYAAFPAATAFSFLLYHFFLFPEYFLHSSFLLPAVYATNVENSYSPFLENNLKQILIKNKTWGLEE